MKKTFFILFAVVLSGLPATVLAKGKSKPRAYSFFDDGGKHSQGTCDSEGKVPNRLKRKAEFSKIKEYKGSEELEFDAHPEAKTMAFKHYFTTQSTCNQVLARQPHP